jgi:peptidoglycan-associated lipoprotein
MKFSNPRSLILVAALGALAALAGCGSPSKVSETAAAPIETRSSVPVSRAASTPAAPAAVSQSRVATVDLAQPPGGSAAPAAAVAPAERIVYFDFDSFVIKDEFKGLIEGHAKVLARDATRRAVVEGHADERGGSEYNLALGQKRAEAVLRSLTLLGVADKQLEAVSFGKERPQAAGHDEAAWARNRRAELKDR